MEKVRQAAQLACRDIYDPVAPDTFLKVYRVGDTVCGLAIVDGGLFIACQGTENVPGWMADVDIKPTDHPVLGPLHSGFYDNLPILSLQLQDDIPKGATVTLTGHSKGAGEAAILAALLELAHINVMRVILFACPHPGTQKLADWMQANIPGVSYRNAPKWTWAGDPVPMVPPAPYVAPYPLTYVNSPPSWLKRMIGVEWHMAERYFQAANALT